MDPFELFYGINFKYFLIRAIFSVSASTRASKQGVQWQGESVSAADTI